MHLNYDRWDLLSGGLFCPKIQLLDEMPHENIGDSLHLHGKMDALINQGVNKFKVFEQNYDCYHS